MYTQAKAGIKNEMIDVSRGFEYKVDKYVH